jgi:8-oxo-dGTP pyrophosphatase MutT (NUDIX family)
MDAEDEIVTIVDEQILTFNSRSELYVHKRTLTKDIFPGYYNPVAGGVVLAGESYEEGAARELEEELGILGVPLKPLFDFFYNDEFSRVWGMAFCCVYDGEVVPQKEEIEFGFFLEIKEVLKLAQSEPFTPDGLHVFKRYLAATPKDP